MSYIALLIVAGIILAVAIPLVFIPGIPVALFMFTVAFAFAFIDNFNHITSSNLVVLGGLVLVSLLVDLFSGIIGAKYGGANAKSLFFGFLGLFVGTFVIPVPIAGSFIGLFLGIYLSEMVDKKTHQKALNSATFSIVGALTGSIINMLISALFLILFIIFAIH